MEDPAGEKSASSQFSNDTESQQSDFQSRHSAAIRRSLHGTAWLALALLFSASYFFQYQRRYGGCSGSPREIDVPATLGIGLPKEVQQTWAQYSPYFPAAEYLPPPERCEIIQVECSRSEHVF